MANRYLLIALVFSIWLHTGAAKAQSAPPEIANLIVGVWRAIPGGLYTEDADGTRTYPYGQDAVTRFILTSDGYGASTLQFRDRPRCAAGTGPRQCTAQESATAFQTATSNQFRYRLVPDADDPYKGSMIWDVDLTVYPNWQGQSLSRRYEINRDGSGWMFIASLPANPRLGLKMHLERERQ